ncbi:MAG: hypothetical protein WC501_00430 [Candidatus Micrarchaeia archaeon]|jgi:hypothetical protein
MKKIILFLILSSFAFSYLSVSDLPQVFYFQGTIYKNGEAECFAQIWDHATVHYFAGDMNGEENYFISLLDKDGYLIGEFNLPVFFYEITDTKINYKDEYLFSIRIPYNTEVNALVLLDNSKKELCRVQRSSADPEIKIISPLSNSLWKSVDYIEWSASDSDGDALYYDIYYDDNGGSGWIMLDGNIKENSYVLFEPIDAVRIMVVANNGFNSASAISESQFANTDLYSNVLVGDKKKIVGEKTGIEPHDFSFMGELVTYEKILPKEPPQCFGLFLILPVLIISLYLFNCREY